MARFDAPISPIARQVAFPNGTQLLTPAAFGTATQMTPSARGLRSWSVPAERDMSAAFDQALTNTGIEEQETIHLETVPNAGLRSGGADDDMILRPAVPPGDTNPRVVLYADDSGGLSWHFAEGALLTASERETLARRGLLRGLEGPEFRIPARSAAAADSLIQGPPRGATRGVITKLGRKVLKVFVIPLAGHLLGKPTLAVASAIEARARKNQVWQLDPANYRDGPSADFTDWQSLDGKPTLLIVHGIFSSVQGMLSQLPPSVLARWHDHYGGRVLGFNHLSATVSPEDNARFFLQLAKQSLPNGKLSFDVLCHSRGGIVSRTLAERGKQLVPDSNADFRRIYFVASPNSGSPLGDPAHIVDMLDVYTNVLPSFPDGEVLFVIEGVLAAVKLLAYTVEIALPGIASMGTSDYIAKVLNVAEQRSPALYAAAASEYFPRKGADNGFLTGPFVTRIVDQAFTKNGRQTANDLIVPRDSVWAGNGHPSFPIAFPLLYAREDGVWHSGFFAEPRTIAAIEGHFEIGAKLAQVQPARDRAGGELQSGAAGVGVPAPSASRPGDDSYRGYLRGSTPEPLARVAAPKSAPKSAPQAVQRDAIIEFHEMVFEGEANDLVVSLKDLRSAADPKALLNVEFAAGEEAIPLSVELTAPGFSIAGTRTAAMTVARVRDPAKERVTFTLTAKHPGDKPLTRKIIASFFRGNDCIGATTHFTAVVPAGYTGPYTPASGKFSDPLTISSMSRENVDLVLTVRADTARADLFELTLRCAIAGEEYEQRDMGTLQLDGTEFGDFFSKTIDPQFQSFPQDPKLSDEEFEQALDGWGRTFLTNLGHLGRKLWSYLPELFRNEYVRLMSLRTPPRSISIYSDEMVLPWELVRPSAMVDGAFREFEPLGVAHIMGRWKPGLGVRPQPQALRVQKMVMLTPQYSDQPLYWAQKESEAVAQLVGVMEQLNPVSVAKVEELLSGTNVQMVHFSGHGDWSPTADLSALRLSDGALSALAFTGRTLGMTAHPFLYLNACTVGRTATNVGRPGGFAATCLDGGWSGIVAPYWRVYDPNAMKFCTQLYRKLACGISVGEAMQEIRRDLPADFTAQSYAYFGDPNARLLIPAPDVPGLSA